MRGREDRRPPEKMPSCNDEAKGKRPLCLPNFIYSLNLLPTLDRSERIEKIRLDWQKGEKGKEAIHSIKKR